MDIPPERLHELMRRAATLARQTEGNFRHIDTAVLEAIGLTDDPVLAERVRHSNHLNLEQWLTQTILEPARLPTYAATTDLRLNARQNARAGWGEIALEAYRAGEVAAWSSWMQIVFGLTDDAAEIRAVLAYSHRSISAFVEAGAKVIREENARGLADLIEGSPDKRRALVEHLLSGEPVEPKQMTRRLGYRLERSHQALILWSTSAHVEPADMDRLVDALVASSDSVAHLTVSEDRQRRWVWMSHPLDAAAVAALCPPHLRLALGPLRHGVEGFRQTHEQAQIAQRILARASTSRRVVHYYEVRLTAALDQSGHRARAFISEVLGDLEQAPLELRQTLHRHLVHGSHLSHTARVLGLHRNTVMRRLALAEERLPYPLETTRIDVAAALEALFWLGEG